MHIRIFWCFFLYHRIPGEMRWSRSWSFSNLFFCIGSGAGSNGLSECLIVEGFPSLWSHIYWGCLPEIYGLLRLSPPLFVVYLYLDLSHLSLVHFFVCHQWLVRIACQESRNVSEVWMWDIFLFCTCVGDNLFGWNILFYCTRKWSFPLIVFSMGVLSFWFNGSILNVISYFRGVYCSCVQHCPLSQGCSPIICFLRKVSECVCVLWGRVLDLVNFFLYFEQMNEVIVN